MFNFTAGKMDVNLDKNWEKNLDLRKELEEIGEDAAANARRMAPVATGALRNSIDYIVEEDSRLYLYAGVEYGAYVELGTRKMAAQPFLRPGLEQAISKRR